MRIYKYTLPQPKDEPEEAGDQATTKAAIEMPVGAVIQSVKSVHGKVRIFALVDPEVDPEQRTFEVWATGVDIPESHKLTHLAVFFNVKGQSFHVFERVA